MSEGSIYQPSSGDHAAPADAGSVHYVLMPEVGELATLRAAVSSWLSVVAERPELIERAQLVAHEMGLLAIDSCASDHPLVVGLRRTHSILVIEVAFERPLGAEVADLRDLGTGDVQLEVRIIEHLADRVATQNGGRRVTIRSTFHLPHAD